MKRFFRMEGIFVLMVVLSLGVVAVMVWSDAYYQGRSDGRQEAIEMFNRPAPIERETITPPTFGHGSTYPGMTTAQRDHLNVLNDLPAGVYIFNLDRNELEQWNGKRWEEVKPQ